MRKEKSNFIKEYSNYSKAFDELKEKLKEKEEKNIQYKIEKYKELYEDFNKSFTDLFNKDNIIKTQKYIDLLYKNLNSKVELSLEQFQILNLL